MQTNEVGRSAALLGGFLLVARESGYPLRCLEVGAAGGLNLLWDFYRYECGRKGFGDPSSPVRIAGAWAAGHPPFEVAARVAERRGCDLEPIDPTSEQGRLTLLSYIWPDQQHRVRQLLGALEVARRHRPVVDRAPAERWLAQKLARPVPGTATVVFQSILMHYLSRAAREQLAAVIEEAGSRACTSAPLAWLRMEHAGALVEVRLTMWPGGRERLIAHCDPHGRDIRWFGG